MSIPTPVPVRETIELLPLSDGIEIASDASRALFGAPITSTPVCLTQEECMRAATDRALPIRMQEHLPTCARCTAFVLALAARPGAIRSAYV